MEYAVLFFILAGVCFLAWFIGTKYQKDSGDIDERVKELQDTKYSGKMGRFAARRETKAALARTETARQINEETKAVTEMRVNQRQLIETQYDLDTTPQRLKRHEEREIFEHENEIAQLALNLQLYQLASKEGHPVETYVELRKKAEMDKLELDKQWQEAEHKLKAGFMYQLQAYQHLALMTEYIGGLYQRAEKLEAEGKSREHKLIEEHIKFMESDFRERQRLLQAANRQDVRAGNEHTQLGGDDQSTVDAKQQPVSIKRNRSRPRKTMDQ